MSSPIKLDALHFWLLYAGMVFILSFSEMVLASAGATTFASVASEGDTLNIKPSRCIALHEGQVCYQTLKIHWVAAQQDTYCLHVQGENTPLLCWENSTTGSGRYEFESNKTQQFLLLRKRDGKLVSSFSIEVAWVYDANSHRKSHWRVF